jgi:hypothetical protein
MKKIIFTLFALSVISLTVAQEKIVSASLKTSAEATFNWANTTFDFGRIKAGVPVSNEFRFTNSGMVPLIISSVKASCGCTVTAYTKDPVDKGGSGFVRATYNAAETGKFSKTVTVTANTPGGAVVLMIKGEVIE